MLLSNKAIFEALEEGRLLIEPEPSPRYATESQKSPYDTTAVNLTLGDTILYLPEASQRTTVNIDFSQPGSIPQTLKQLYSEKRIGSDGYRLLPNSFVLAKTHEKITLPLEQKGSKPLLAARVEGKSSFARCGLLVHFTAPTIHAGFSGTITLEIICLGGYPIHLTPGMQICQLLIEEVVGLPEAYAGQFQGQSSPAGPTAS